MGVTNPNGTGNYKSFYNSDTKRFWIQLNTKMNPPKFVCTNAATSEKFDTHEIGGRFMGLYHFVDVISGQDVDKIGFDLYDATANEVAHVQASLGARATRNMLNCLMSLTPEQFQKGVVNLQLRASKGKDDDGNYTIEKKTKIGEKIFELEFWLKGMAEKGERIWGYYGEKCEDKDGKENTKYMSALEDAKEDKGNSLTLFWKKQIKTNDLINRLNGLISEGLKSEGWSVEVGMSSKQKPFVKLVSLDTTPTTDTKSSNEDDDIPPVAGDDQDVPF